MWNLGSHRRKSCQDDVVVVTRAVGLADCDRVVGHNLRVLIVL